MTTLYDYLGRPVDSGTLNREISGARITSVRSPFDPIIATGLTPERLARMIAAAQAGQHDSYLLLAREMEQRDGHYYSTLQTRKLSVTQLPRRIEAANTDTKETAIVDMLTALVNGEGFTDVLFDVMDGLGKGFSVTEIIWDTTRNEGRLWLPKAYAYRRPQWYRFDPVDGETLLLKTERAPIGEPLTPFKFIQHRPKIISGSSLGGGLARPVALLHMFKSYTLKDWLAFAEVFGQPVRIGRFPDKADPNDVRTLREAVSQIGSDAAAVLPMSMRIDFERAANSGFASGDSFFLNLHDTLNKEISKIVLGQTMSAEDGSSLAQAKVHDDVRREIMQADARQLSDTINRDVIRPIIDLNFGPRPAAEDYPRLVIDSEEPEDLKLLAEALIPFINAGLRVEESVILDKFNLPEPDPANRLLSSAAAIGAEYAPKPVPGEDEAKPFGGKKKAPNTAELTARILDAMDGETNMRNFRRKMLEVIDAMK